MEFIYGNHKIYILSLNGEKFFKAADIGKVLGLTNIRASLSVGYTPKHDTISHPIKTKVSLR